MLFAGTSAVMLTASAFKEPFLYLDRDENAETTQRYKEDMEDAHRESQYFRVSQLFCNTLY